MTGVRNPPLLHASGIRKVIGGTAALVNADLRAYSGEIHGVLGENGAGKSTLTRVIGGITASDGGAVRLDGSLLPAKYGTAFATSLGIAMIHQDPSLVPDLSIEENIALLGGYPVDRGLISRRNVTQQAREVLALMGLDLDPGALVRSLPLGRRALVAIAAAVGPDARVLILDEPTASLSGAEANRLFEALTELRQRGLAIVLVSHRLDEIMAHCERVTVLRNGTTVAEREVSELTKKDLVSYIVGNDAPPQRQTARATHGSPIVSVDSVSIEHVSEASFSVREREIVVITGSLSSGHHLLGQVVGGQRPPDRGTIRIDGAQRRFSGPRHAVRNGVRFMPGERAMGLAGHMTVRENLYLDPSVDRVRWLKPTSERRSASTSLRQFRVRPPEPDREVSTLSGGNAQKVLLARTLRGAPRLVVLVEPTSGVDVGARAELYELLYEAANESLAIVVVTSDFEEAAQLGDRVLVMRRGQLARELAGADASVAAITHAAIA